MPQHVQENQSTQNLGLNNMLALRARSFVPDGNVPGQPLVPQQQRYQMGISQEVCKIKGQGLLLMFQELPSGQDMIVAYTNTINPGGSFHGKRENQDTQSSPLSSSNKRARLTPAGPDGIQQQQMGPHMDSLHESKMNWKNSPLQQQAMTRGIQYANAGIQKYPHQMLEGGWASKCCSNIISAGQRADDGSRKQAIWTHSTYRCSKDYHNMSCDLISLRLDGTISVKIVGRRNHTKKRKSAHSPRLSTGLAQSPSIIKNLVNCPVVQLDPIFGATVALGQHQAQISAKRRSNSSFPENPNNEQCEGLPAGVLANISVPLNASSPSVGTPQWLIKAFSKDLQ
ncbi:hypothetical protein OIU84_022710, partial [Salix udensis]